MRPTPTVPAVKKTTNPLQKTQNNAKRINNKVRVSHPPKRG